MKALRIILASIKKADDEFNLFKENLNICIGLSGGKDSMALLYALNIYKKYSKINFNIYPMMIDLGFPSFNENSLKEYVKSLGYDLYIEDSKQVYEILKIQKEKQNLKHLPCSICSKMKKAIINKVAHKLNCEYVSFAHHMDDLIETLFLNEIYGGKIASFSPKMYLTNEKINFIRPFIYVKEKDIIRLIKEENIPVFKSNCPNDKKTERESIKQILNDLYLKYPQAQDNFLTMQKNYSKFDLLMNEFDYKVKFSPLHFKLINNIDDFLIEQKYTKIPLKNYQNNSFHLHYYNNEDELIGVIIFKKEDRNFKIIYSKFSDLTYINQIIFDLYFKIYSKYNPINFEFNLNNIPYSKLIIPYIKKGSPYKKIILININPAKIEKLFK